VVARQLANPVFAVFNVLTGRVAKTHPTVARTKFMARIAALLVAAAATFAAGPAAAQSGTMFNDTPPRPPADVPNTGFPAQPPPVQYPGQPYSPPPQQAQPQRYSAPQPQKPVATRQPTGIQAQPLPPPPGATMAPPPPPGAQDRTTPPLANPPPPQPADTSPQPDDTVVTMTPTQKIENGRAVFAGLDKITGRTISFDAAIGETVQFGALQVTARACYTRPPTEATNTDAFVEVDEVTLQGEIKRIFTGWMFAASPGLHAVEHPIYDVWLTDCTQPADGSVAQTAVPAAPAAGVPPPGPTTPGRSKPPAARQPAPASAAAPITDD
jgi:hypothetical protein